MTAVRQSEISCSHPSIRKAGGVTATDMNDDLPVTEVTLLRDCGKDEYWLQDKIFENSSILGLGDLERVSKEKPQSSGGRLDLLLKDPEDDSMFEVEVMLGETDE